LTVEARLFVVRGRVQRVGFRYFAVLAASRLGLSGWARNRPDGSVEVMAQGTTGAIDELAGMLAKGPPASRVESVEVEVAAPDPSLSGFGVRH